MLEEHVGIRAVHLVLPSAATSYVGVSGTAPTRYVLDVRVDIDQDLLPGPLQEEQVFPAPDLGDPPFRIDREVRHVLIDLDAPRLAAGPLVLAEVGEAPLSVDLLRTNGTTVRSGEQVMDTLTPATSIGLANLAAGTYLLRLGHAGDADLQRPLDVEVVPMLP